MLLPRIASPSLRHGSLALALALGLPTLISCVPGVVGDGSGQEGGGGKADDPDGGGGGGGGGGVQPELRLTGSASALSCYRSPAGENIANLSDGDTQTKFLAFNNSVAVDYDAGEPVLLTRYAFTSANDFPERDPRSWLLLGSNDNENWDELDRRLGVEFAERFERREFAVDAASAYRFYRLRMENRASGVTQLSELEMHGRRPFGQASAAPQAPSGFVATASSRTTLALSWTDNSDSESYFQIEASSDGQNFSAIAYAPADVTSLELRGLAPGQERSYRVLAVNGVGLSAPSPTQLAASLPRLVGTSNGAGSTTFREGQFSITLIDNNTGTPQAFKDGVVEEFFRSFPPMIAAYNPAGVRDVNVTFDPNYDGIAFANFGTGNITIASQWAKTTEPDGPLVMIHEGFHLVQNYNPFDYNTPKAPGWATEGLADYVRWQFDTAHPAGCWTMQRYEPGHNFTDAYGVTARFLLWLDDEVKPGIAKSLDASMRSGQYTEAFWTNETGKSVETLWAEYAAVPAHDPVQYFY